MTLDVMNGVTDIQVYRFDAIAPDWTYRKRLRVMRLMLESRAHIGGFVRHGHAKPIYDQDLGTDEARQVRWLEMARQLKAQIGMCLPHALELVRTIRPSSDPHRPMSVWYEPNRIFNEGLREEHDLWWLSKKEEGHPLSPPGFILGEAISVSVMAKERCGETSALPKKISVLVKPDHTRHMYTHTYFKRGELNEISPVPPAAVLRSPEKFAKYLDCFFNDAYPGMDELRRKDMLNGWCKAVSDTH